MSALVRQAFRATLTTLPVAVVALFLALLATPPAQSKDWNIQTINGLHYVAENDIQQFYGFSRVAREGGDRVFHHESLTMRWKTGSQVNYIRNIKFILSFPITERSGKALISTLDLQKLVDPVLRPAYIKRPINFDTVIIDAGHGAHDTGAKGVVPGGFEKNYALDLSLRIEAELKRRGFKTKMTRRDDTFLTLSQRVDFANKVRNSIFISIHFNSSGSRSASGIETYSLAPQGTASTNGGSASNSLLTGHLRDAENISLATAVHAHVIHDMKLIDRGIKRARFSVIRGINKPAILFEGGFITHPTEGKLINSDQHRQRLAVSIANAIQKYQAAVGKKK